VSASASDPDGSVAKVDFYQGATLIGTATAAPYNITWTGVPQGSYSLTAVATDDAGATATSDPVAVTVGAHVAQMYFVHPDHLNTPRSVTDRSGNEVWRWDNTEPFGDSTPNDDPSGFGAFEFALRLSNYYADKETGKQYAMMRDCYDPVTGRFCESDAIGLKGGPNTYLHVDVNPLGARDPSGLSKCFFDPPNLDVSQCTLMSKTESDRDLYDWRLTDRVIWATLPVPKPQFGMGPSRPNPKLPPSQPPVGPTVTTTQYWEIQIGYDEETLFRQSMLTVVEKWRCPGPVSCGPNDPIKTRTVTCFSDWEPTQTTRTSWWMHSFLRQVK